MTGGGLRKGKRREALAASRQADRTP